MHKPGLQEQRNSQPVHRLDRRKSPTVKAPSVLGPLAISASLPSDFTAIGACDCAELHAMLSRSGPRMRSASLSETGQMFWY